MGSGFSGRFGLILVVGILPLLAACKQEAEAPPAAPRQVRTTVIAERDGASTVSLTGRIEAEDEVPLAFRIGGRLLENNGKLGERMQRGDLVARLESQNEENQLRAATAALAAARSHRAGAETVAAGSRALGGAGQAAAYMAGR